ncbi:DUF5794 domain-containing protein [Halalkalirubrum salinum]|uniref:DUF5794 domain-containing protein n=1 Tax=Halalkalirubrum salinum TaxID=2563889 RepID=UPI0010FB881C|nr:DUF5794 domain-containing protein [Halalkalirubrum salinum]
MSVSLTLIAVVDRLYRWLTELFSVDGASQLAWVMLLPLAGIYQALIVGGALSSVSTAVGLGTVIFGGGATLGIVTAELDVPRRRGLQIVGFIGIGLLVGTTLSAVIAPVVAAVLWSEVLNRLTAVVIGLIAIRMVYQDPPWWVPAVQTIGGVLIGVIVLNVLVSIATGSIELSAVIDQTITVVTTDHALIGRSIVAGGSGLTLAVGAVLFRPTVVRVLDIQRFEVGCAIALTTLAAELASIIETAPVLLIIGCSFCLSVKHAYVGGMEGRE